MFHWNNKREEPISAFEATYGRQSGPRRVHGGVDERQQVSNASVYPWRAHAHLKIAGPRDGAFIGTGFFVGPRLLLTAGHNVFFNGDQTGWSAGITVTPGANGPGNAPFREWRSKRLFSNTNWLNSRDPDFDYGAILLDADVAASTGTLGFEPVSDAPSGVFEIGGYPVFKPRTSELASETLWSSSGPLQPGNSRSLFYQIDTESGQSGSPVFFRRGDFAFAIAIHIEGHLGFNRGLRLTQEMQLHIEHWLKER